MTARPPAGEYALEAHQITKVFPGTTALAGVDFRVARGHVHALIGENGAGKSTLVKILAGIEQPTSGSLIVDGAPVRLESVKDAARRGIGVIHQELQLFPDLSITENLFVGRELRTRWRAIDARAQRKATIEVLTRLSQSMDPDTRVGALPLGLQQIVEIARALVHDARVLMMDEPTSALTATEVGVLFRIIRGLAARGVAIVYISHRLEELLEISDSVSILRDGRLVGEAPSSEIGVAWIVERMTGTAAGDRAPRPHGTAGNTVLSVRDLHLPARPGRAALNGVSLQLKAGEIVGVYGLMGAGRTELFETILGVHADAAGEIVLQGQHIDRLTVADRVRAGLALVPEDRQAAGLIQTMDVVQNMTLSSLAQFCRAGCLSTAKERQRAQALAGDLRIKARSIRSPIGSLSGGNQQKVVISRAMMRRPQVLLFDEPTRGVDVAARTEVIGCARRLAEDGMAVMYASSDLGEVFDVADRVLVLSRGRVTAEGPAADFTEHAVASAASQGGVDTPGRIDANA
jgi:erythritol transport system ATP-binding protein